MDLAEKISEKNNLNLQLTELLLEHNPSAMLNFLKLNKDLKSRYHLKFILAYQKYREKQKTLFGHYINSFPSQERYS